MKKSLMIFMVICAVVGCSKEEQPKQPVADGEEYVVDTNYVAALARQRSEKKELMQKFSKAKTDQEKKAAAAELEKNRQETMRIVREKMNGQ